MNINEVDELADLAARGTNLKILSDISGISTELIESNH